MLTSWFHQFKIRYISHIEKKSGLRFLNEKNHVFPFFSIFPYFLDLPIDGFLRSLWNVFVMVHILPNHCHLLDFRGQKNVQLYRTYGRIQNPNLLADLLGFCSPSLYGLFVLILFHQVHPYHVWQGLCLSSMGWDAWIYDQLVFYGEFKRSIFQTFRKPDFGARFLFFKLETSNFGYLLIF